MQKTIHLAHFDVSVGTLTTIVLSAEEPMFTVDG
jgi:hypothetical protein